MQLQIDLSIIVSSLAVIGVAVTYITAANKIRFEVDLLKKQNEDIKNKVADHETLLSKVNKDGLICRNDTAQKIGVLKDDMEKMESRVGKNESRLTLMRDEGSAPTIALGKRFEALDAENKEVRKILNQQSLDIAEIRMIVKNIDEHITKERG